MLSKLRRELESLANPKKAKIYARFFKTGKGEYGEGDVFIGLTVPESRSISKKYKALTLKDIKKLLQSKIHEERLIGLLILVHNFKKGSDLDRKEIYEYYLAHTQYINNWDLVDLSADKIVGSYLLNRDRSILIKLAKSNSLWEKRIAMITTYQFIKERSEYEDTFKIAEILLNDSHDLIHKAVGWMLREVGKRCGQEVLEKFLRKHYKVMPRTMLRYAIEHFPEKLRRVYLEGSI